MPLISGSSGAPAMRTWASAVEVCLSAELSAADFHSRGTGARAVALASQQSRPLISRAVCAEAVADAEQRLSADPGVVSPSWQVYVVAAHTVEFWQADKDRQHLRVQYRDRGRGWEHTLLWP